METDLRPLTRADIPAWAALLASSEAVDHTGEHYSETDLAEAMDDPQAEVGKDFPGALEGARLVAYDASRADDLRRAHDAAFGGDHPGFTEWTEASWASSVTESHTFRPALTR